jgi:hypothetical protein
MPPRCWRCRPISAAAGGHAAAICIAMATCKRKLRSSGAPRREGGQCGRRRWEGSRCQDNRGASGPGPRSGPCPVAAHSGPHRTRAHARGRVHGQQRTENRSSDMRMAIYSCFMGRIRKRFHSNIMHRIHGMHLHTEHEWYRHEGCMACLMLSCDAYYSDSGRVAPPSSFITRLTRQRRLDSDSSNTHLSRRRGRIVGFPSVQDKLST